MARLDESGGGRNKKKGATAENRGRLRARGVYLHHEVKPLVFRHSGNKLWREHLQDRQREGHGQVSSNRRRAAVSRPPPQLESSR